MKKLLLITTLLALSFMYVSAQNYDNIVTYSFNGTPTNGIKIKTNIPFQNGQNMPYIKIEGYDFGKSMALSLNLVFYVYSNRVNTSSVSSNGGSIPDVWLANEDGKVSIFLDEKVYYQRFTVSAFAKGMASDNAASFTGWTVVDEPLSGTQQIKVAYKNNFAGKVGIGTESPQHELDVIGTGHFSEDLTIDGDLLVKGKITGSDYTSNMKIDRLNVPLDLTVGGGTGWASEYSLQVKTSAQVDNKLKTKDLEVTGEARLPKNVTIGTPGTVDGSLDVNGFVYAKQIESPTGVISAKNLTAYEHLYSPEALATLKDVNAETITASKNISTSGNINSNTLNVDLAISTGHLVTDYLTVDKTITTKDLEATGTGHFTGNVAIDGNLQIKGNITGQNFAGLGGNTFTEAQHVQGESHGFTVGPANFWSRMTFSYWGSDTQGAGYIRYPRDLWIGPNSESNPYWIHFGRTGNVGIGTSCHATYKLQVNGIIRAEELIIETGWADYVFDKDYKLPSLEEVENHINTHGHLPSMPSEAEVKENGIGISEITTKLLQKIEELTLYTIQQEKRALEQEKLLMEQAEIIRQLQRNSPVN